MSSLYRARVDRVAPPKVRLTVWQIHPDAGEPPASMTFALALICAPFRNVFVLEGNAPSGLSPLAQAVDIDGGEDGDEAWVRDNTRAFIKRFTRKGSKNAATASSRTLPETGPRYDQNLGKLPQAVFELEATDPAWVEHLTPGLAWRTAAYDIGEAKPAAARHPGDEDEEPPPEPARASKKTPASASARYLQFKLGTSNKFWEIKLRGKAFTTRYGRIGATVTSETKTQCASAAEARREFDEIVARKLAKGYRDASRPR